MSQRHNSLSPIVMKFYRKEPVLYRKKRNEELFWLLVVQTKTETVKEKNHFVRIENKTPEAAEVTIF